MNKLTIEHAREIVESIPYLKSRLDPQKNSGEIIYWVDFLSIEKEQLARLAELIPHISVEIKLLPTNPQLHLLKMHLKENHTAESLITRFVELQIVAKSCGIDEIDEVGVGVM